jgi:hypothetical protein
MDENVIFALYVNEKQPSPFSLRMGMSSFVKNMKLTF